MVEFADLVRGRRMTRDFLSDPIPDGVLEHLVDLASRSPSAGKTQGWHLLVLRGAETAKFWDLSLPDERRSGFRWPGLLKAPVIALMLADPGAYVERYSEPDKARTGLGESVDAWPTPYWTVDGSMAMMTLLLAAEEQGLGALLFGVFTAESEIRDVLGIPAELQILGAIALGHRAGSPGPGPGPGRSASRPRRPPGDIIHFGHW
jgi:nitroreductase